MLGFVARTPGLAGAVKVDRWTVTNARNGATFEVLAAETARAALATLWAEQAAERRQAAADASARLSQLAAGAEPATSAPAAPDDLAEVDLADARRRGRQWRAEHDSSSTDPWAGFRIIGAGS